MKISIAFKKRNEIKEKLTSLRCIRDLINELTTESSIKLDDVDNLIEALSNRWVYWNLKYMRGNR